MKTIKSIQKISLVAVALLGVAGLSAGAQAADGTIGVATRSVRYSDLDLNTAAGAKILYQRIHRAADQVCGNADSRQEARVAAIKACVDQAIVSSVKKVNSAGLSRTATAQGYPMQTRLDVASVQ